MVQTLTQQATRKGSNEYATGIYVVCMDGCINILWCVYACVCVCISTYVQYVWVHVCICICTYVHMCAMCSGSLIYDCYIYISHLLYITKMTGACVQYPPFCSVSRPQHMRDYRTDPSTTCQWIMGTRGPMNCMKASLNTVCTFTSLFLGALLLSIDSKDANRMKCTYVNE